MRRALPYVAAWVAAAAVAVLVAWQGVAVVGDQVTSERPRPLTAAEIESAISDAPTTGVPTTSTLPAPTSSPATTTPGSNPETTTEPPPTTAQPTTPPAGETRTYNLVGGSAALRFEAAGVTVLWANPNAGFEVDVEPEHGNGVKVEFESEAHRSRVDGWWEGGPQERVREEPR